MTLRKCLSLAVFLSALNLFTGAALAQKPELIGRHGAWEAYKIKDGSDMVCYMVSQPTAKKGNYTKRGDVYALITHRPAESTYNVFSYMTGYAYKAGSDAAVTIDGQKIALFTQEETAWAPDPQTDEKIANLVRKGSRMVVTGTSTRGTLTTDNFSLSGSGAAYDAISKECGVRGR